MRIRSARDISSACTIGSIRVPAALDGGERQSAQAVRAERTECQLRTNWMKNTTKNAIAPAENTSRIASRRPISAKTTNIVSAKSRLSILGTVALTHATAPVGRAERNSWLWNAHGIAARSPDL